ncbi:hydroxypyruvate isomerase family protein [Roseicyclus marinus]|uniref:hydroxypyruvate isomerase family protein n=1 Tax=Roseicyclus marinus TaxID=2161673 RepID=UPI00240F3165|nr:TIM barrel protein [Roseicyclus marinus]MDG3040492.1 TIM barrel protein [Roseicyclus marinus]
MTLFSANLGFLWTELALPDAIRAAKAAGFDAVEFHWPYDVDPANVRAALLETGLPVLGLNTRRGDVPAGENGLAALPGREKEARSAIDEALAYARAVGAGAVHVMAGRTEGEAARQTFLDNLRYACAEAGHDRIILIEPLNPWDAPGYFLNRTEQAAEIITEIAAPNLRLMFDCYHVGRTEGDVVARLRALWPLIGHIQFASVPDRGAPDHGSLDYAPIFAEIVALGWARPLGAEYKVAGATEDSLAWLHALRGR